MVNEKKGEMMSYMRSMGMMESSNLLGYFPLFFLFSLVAAVTHELPQIWFRLTQDVPRHLGDPVGTHREKETISVQTRRV